MTETHIKRNISTQATHSLPPGPELNIIPITVLGSHTAHPTLPNDHWQWQKQILQILPLMLTAHSPRQYTHASILFISLPRKRFYEDKLSCEKFKRQFLLHFYSFILTLIWQTGDMGLISTTNILEAAKTEIMSEWGGKLNTIGLYSDTWHSSCLLVFAICQENVLPWPWGEINTFFIV